MKIKIVFTILFLLFSTAAAHATSYPCTGKVSQVTVDRNGMVNASFTFGTVGMPWEAVCGLTDTVYGIALSSCKGMLSLLLLAEATQKNVTMFFDNATPNDCNHKAWDSLNAKGWYWGPTLLP